MTTRESLHKLLDTLPEAALESTERVLQNYKAWMWPPQQTDDLTKMRQEVEERFRKSAAEHAARTGRGVISSSVSGSRFKPDGDGMSSMSGWEGETLVTVELHVFRGHRLEIEERLRISDDKKSLLYAQHVKGPGEKDGHTEFEFNIAPHDKAHV
jgi:hypothetical protein